MRVVIFLSIINYVIMSEVFSLEQHRDNKVDALRQALEQQGWRPLADIVYTHDTSYGADGFETRQIKTVDQLKQEILDEYKDDDGRFDEVELIPTNPYENPVQSYYAYVRNAMMRRRTTAPEQELKHAA
jgi:hypothetical protein